MKNLQKEIDLVSKFYKSKKFAKAEKLCKKLIIKHSNVDLLYNILGLILTEEKKIDEAIDSYKKGIEINPNSAIMYNNIAGLYKNKRNFEEAKKLYQKGILLNKSIPDIHNNLGNLHKLTNEYEKAKQCYLKSIEIDPNYSIGYYNLGIICKSLGDKVGATENLKKAIKLNQNLFNAHRALSQITKYKKNILHLNEIKLIYNNDKIKKKDKVELIFALAKAYDDLEDYKKAFSLYNEANKLKKNDLNFSLSNEIKEFNEIKKIFNKNFINSFESLGNISRTPIFILGMPRSGTTLVEQIISNHPKVFGGDELNFFPELINKYFLNTKNLSKINNKIIKNFSSDYLNELKNISMNLEKVTDKLPINFKWIGLIKILFPNAIVIHCKRNPKDVCFSIYKNFFTNKELGFSYDLEDIIKFYNMYEDLMNHWKLVMPNFIYDINYEKIINNANFEIKNIINICNLPWDNHCLKFYENKRAIKTASDTQARSQLYSSSINIWKNYEVYLKKSFKNLTKNVS